MRRELAIRPPRLLPGRRDRVIHRVPGHERSQHPERHPVRQPAARTHHAIVCHKPRSCRPPGRTPRSDTPRNQDQLRLSGIGQDRQEDMLVSALAVVQATQSFRNERTFASCLSVRARWPWQHPASARMQAVPCASPANGHKETQPGCTAPVHRPPSGQTPARTPVQALCRAPDNSGYRRWPGWVPSNPFRLLLPDLTPTTRGRGQEAAPQDSTHPGKNIKTKIKRIDQKIKASGVFTARMKGEDAGKRHTGSCRWTMTPEGAASRGNFLRASNCGNLHAPRYRSARWLFGNGKWA